MAQAASIQATDGGPAFVKPGLTGVAADFAADKQAFPVHWGKAMMWIFLLSDTFIFSCFLTSYMTMRASVTAPWPNPSEVFALTIGGQSIPLAPGCSQYVLPLATAIFVPLGATSFQSPQTYPNDPAFAGLRIFAQAVAVDAPFSVLTTNGLQLYLETF